MFSFGKVSLLWLNCKWQVSKIHFKEVARVGKQCQEVVTQHVSHLFTYVGNSQQTKLLYSDIPGMVGSVET